MTLDTRTKTPEKTSSNTRHTDKDIRETKQRHRPRREVHQRKDDDTGHADKDVKENNQ